MRTERLTESAEGYLALTESQAMALARLGRNLASRKAWWGEKPEDVDAHKERTVIRCTPERPGLWRVRVADAVGVIAVDGLQIVVGAKIPAGHLLYLMEKSGRLPRLAAEGANVAVDKTMWELVAEWYTASLEGVLRRDLIKDYRAVTDELQLARGHVDLYRTARAYYDGRLVIACEFDEFDADTPLNRVLRAAAAGVAGSPLLRPELRRRARRLLARMDHVGEMRLGDRSVSVDRRTAHYRDAVSLAIHIIDGQGRGLEHGGAASWAFLIRTPEMIEEGLRRVLVESLAGRWRVRKRRVPVKGTGLTLNPDLVFNETMAAGDIKYKLASDWVRADLYQVVTFAEGVRARFGCVVNFQKGTVKSLPPLLIGEISVSHFSWNADPDVAPEDAGREVAGAVVTWLEGISRPPVVSEKRGGEAAEINP
ncbi:MAG TPA: hypothetical protein VIQ24_19125 [Pyrinomonadaceae bacterium]